MMVRDNGVGEAIKTLLVKLDEVTADFNQQAVNAIKMCNYSLVCSMYDDAVRLIEFRNRAKLLLDDWNAWILSTRRKIESESSRMEVKKQDEDSGVLKVLTPCAKFRFPILQTLIELGGKAEPKVLLDIVGEKMKDELTEYDKMYYRNQRKIRWRSNARNCCQKMAAKGLVRFLRAENVWEITDLGRLMVGEVSG